MKNKKPLAFSTVLSTAFLVTMSEGAAQEASLPEVVVTGSSDQTNLLGARKNVTNAATGLPSALTVITREEVESINVGRDISNIFRRTPGVVANSLDQGDTGNGFKMRGFATQGSHGADTAVYVDGVPQNMPSSEAGAGHGPAFLEWLTPDMIQRVEVIKGPVSALHGDQNRSGAVNIWTASGGDVPSSAGVTVESYGGKRASVVLSKDFDGLQSLLVADTYRTDSYRDGAWLDRDNLFWKLSTEKGNGRYSLRLNHYRSEFEAAGYLRYDRLAAGLVERSASEENALLSFGNGKRTSLVFNRTPSRGEEGLYATAYIEDFERVRGAASTGNVHNVGSDDRVILGGRLSNNFVFDNYAALQVGADFRRDKGEGIRQRYVNYAPTSTYLTYLDMDLHTYGLFAQGQFKPTDTLKLMAGLRNDYFDYDIDNRKLPAASTKYKDSVLTPKLGAVWSMTPRLDIFSNIAQGFRSPAAQQISPSGSQGPLGASGGTVNDSISPSKVESIDLGFTAEPADGWSASGALFYTLNEDEIVQTAPNVFSSVGDTTRKGFELESRFRLGRNFSAYASYTRLIQAEVNNPEPNTPYLLSVPKHQLKIGGEYRHPVGNGSLTYNADAYLTSDIPYFSGTPLQLGEVPTYTRYDLRITYDYRDFQLTAFAIFQPHLISEAFFSNAGGLWVSTQAPRQFGITAKYFF